MGSCIYRAQLTHFSCYPYSHPIPQWRSWDQHCCGLLSQRQQERRYDSLIFPTNIVFSSSKCHIHIFFHHGFGKESPLSLLLCHGWTMGWRGPPQHRSPELNTDFSPGSQGENRLAFGHMPSHSLNSFFVPAEGLPPSNLPFINASECATSFQHRDKRSLSTEIPH